MQRISIVAATAIAAIAVGGTAADAAVKKGKFAGTTAENDPIGFKVTKSHKVTRLYFEGVTLHCSNGDTTDTPSGDDRIELPSRLKFKIKKSRRFTVAVHSDLGLRINARGRFNKKGRKAGGTLKVRARFDSQSGQQDPNGDVRCQSHKLKWTAKRQ